MVSQFHFCIMDPTSQRNAHHCVYSEICICFSTARRNQTKTEIFRGDAEAWLGITNNVVFELYTHVLFVCVSVHHMYTCYWQRSEEGVGVPEIGVTYSCELTCGFWELTLGLQTEQKVLLATELSCLRYLYIRLYIIFLP